MCWGVVFVGLFVLCSDVVCLGCVVFIVLFLLDVGFVVFFWCLV